MQITYQDKATQTEPDNIMEDMLKAITTLCHKVDSIDLEVQKLKVNEVTLKPKASTSQPHDFNYAELRRSEDGKIPELKGDDGKLLKTHNNSNISSAGTSKAAGKRPINNNLNSLFDKPFIQRQPTINIPTPQTSSYAASLNQEKQIYNHISSTYIRNLHKTITHLNLRPRSTTTTEPNTDYITQKLQGYNKLIAQPKTNANLVKTCYDFGLLNIVYTTTGAELEKIPAVYNAFTTYKRITKGTFFYVRFYVAPAEILFNEIKPIIQVIKIGLTKDMILPEEIGPQPEIPEKDIPSFMANKRLIGLTIVIQELVNNYSNGNAIWKYSSRDQVMIYSNSRELRIADMEEVRQWILSLLKPEEAPTTRALKKEFISPELLTRYCQLIGQKYTDHRCSKCNGGDTIHIPEVILE